MRKGRAGYMLCVMYIKLLCDMDVYIQVDMHAYARSNLQSNPPPTQQQRNQDITITRK